jgi:hypothetical protein
MYIAESKSIIAHSRVTDKKKVWKTVNVHICTQASHSTIVHVGGFQIDRLDFDKNKNMYRTKIRGGGGGFFFFFFFAIKIKKKI